VHDISDLNCEGLPSNKRLVKATLIALLVASALLVTAILPAEYGVDPTGLGAKMGLTALGSISVSESAATSVQFVASSSSTDTAPVRKSESPYRSDTMTLSLLPNQGAEIKAVMQLGDNFVFNWEVKGGSVYFDMHGEPINAVGDEFTSYWISENESSASGSFDAPFAGTHGWYWQNKGPEPVAVHLSTSGFYEELYTP
jgi:hypothetical protein